MNGILITIVGISIIFIATSVGALTPLLIKKRRSESFYFASLAFSSGVMLSATVWSLILPAIESIVCFGNLKIVPTCVGILAGCLFMTAVEKGFPEPAFHKGDGLDKPIKLFIAVTMHNVPEGLAVGVALGSAKISGGTAEYFSALAFSIGIAIQNIPEGACVAIPFENIVKNKKTASMIGVLSGAVEPLFAVLGYFLSWFFQPIEGWLLAFSAGAMIFVVVGDLLPESFKKPSLTDVWLFVIGFLLMMTLDLTFG